MHTLRGGHRSALFPPGFACQPIFALAARFIPRVVVLFAVEKCHRGRALAPIAFLDDHLARVETKPLFEGGFEPRSRTRHASDALDAIAIRVAVSHDGPRQDIQVLKEPFFTHVAGRRAFARSPLPWTSRASCRVFIWVRP